MKKRFKVLSLLLGCSLFLVGCGNKNTNENTIKTKIDRRYQDNIEKINNTLEMIRKIYNCQSLLKVFIIVEFIIIILLNIKKTFKNIYVTNAGCVISSHCGPHTIGILYIKKTPLTSDK